MTAIPRIGAEVLVAFMDGNPDRPVITGMVPGANTMPPWTLPANKTQSGMLSRSSPGGGYHNANAIRFEDKRGAEQLWIQAERNLDTVVKGSETRSVGGARTVSVGAANAESIGGDATCDVGGACSTTVKRDMTVNVTEGRQESTVKSDIMVTSLSGEVMVTSPRKLTLSVGGSSITMTPDEITIVAGKIFLNP